MRKGKRMAGTSGIGGAIMIVMLCIFVFGLSPLAANDGVSGDRGRKDTKNGTNRA
jgi:hypothetical protein